jgi:hypothetical protein
MVPMTGSWWPCGSARSAPGDVCANVSILATAGECQPSGAGFEPCGHLTPKALPGLDLEVSCDITRRPVVPRRWFWARQASAPEWNCLADDKLPRGRHRPDSSCTLCLAHLAPMRPCGTPSLGAAMAGRCAESPSLDADALR